MFSVSAFRTRVLTPALAAVLGLWVATSPAAADQSRMAGDNRTANRTADGLSIYPPSLFATPEHYEFLPMTSNHDPHHQHPQQWDGQDWDPAAWDGKQWTPETTLKKFFRSGIFYRQYMGGSKRVNNPKVQAQIPVLEVGPRFFKLSDLDRRRSLKLLADYTEVFQKGFESIELRDWNTQEILGHYTPKGMFLY